MLADDKLIAYLAGTLQAEERARVETDLAGDAEALLRVLDQERLDAALRLLLNPSANRAQVKASILAGIRTTTHAVSADEVMKQVLLESGKNALAYRPPKDENAPGLLATLASAFREWFQTNHARVVVYGGLAALLVFIASEVRISHVKKLTAQQQTDTFEGSRRSDGLVTRTPSVPRDLAQWPFAADSVWNTPIGSGAQFAAVQPGGLDLTTGVMIVDANRSHPVFRATTNDPMGNLLVAGKTAPFATVQIPAALSSSRFSGPRSFLVLPDGVTLFELSGARLVGSDLQANYIVRADLRGSGIPPDYRAATGSGLSQLAGSIRRGELTARIPHVIGAVAVIEAIALKPDGTAHVWPAAWSHANDPGTAARMARLGNVHVGSLLAIPPTVDIAKLAPPGTPAHTLMRAMQDYGVLVKDTFDGTYLSEWQRLGEPHLILCVEDLFNGDAPQNLTQQLAPAIRELRVVANHGPTTLGGGGARRVNASGSPSTKP